MHNFSTLSRLLALLSVELIFATSFCRAEVAMSIPPGRFALKLGDGSLDDPSGKSHTKASVAGKVVVAIFSAPNMNQGNVQKRWAVALADDPQTKVPNAVGLFLVEDMSQAGMFKGMAQDSMKKDFTPDSRPVLLLDPTGQLFKNFGVPRNSTEILIYDKTGTLRDVETDLSKVPNTAARVRAICRQLESR